MLKQIRTLIVLTVLVAFIGTSIESPVYGSTSLTTGTQMAFDNQLPWMPKPGVRVGLSPDFTPAELKGITIHPENPLMFDFIVYRGDKILPNGQKKEEYKRLIKYFLASLAVPDEDQWVNLSPYEKNRIIKDDFGKTLMGRDLLAQDYVLKQITASLIYPEGGLGKKFWNKVYLKAQEQYGTTNIPVDTFNKVWIIPDNALIYEKGNTAYVIKNHLKVMLEEDYLALSKHQSRPGDMFNIGANVIRELVLPTLEKEVNTAQNFALLRQVYSGMLLAAWFKRTLKKSLLGEIYANKTKVKGVDQDPKNNEAIYQRYLRAYKKGVFNYIKEDVNKYTNEAIPRKYFSGGAVDDYAMILKITRDHGPGDSVMKGDAESNDLARVSMYKVKTLLNPDKAMLIHELKEMSGGARKAIGERNFELARTILDEMKGKLDEIRDDMEGVPLINVKNFEDIINDYMECKWKMAQKALKTGNLGEVENTLGEMMGRPYGQTRAMTINFLTLTRDYWDARSKEARDAIAEERFEDAERTLDAMAAYPYGRSQITMDIFMGLRTIYLEGMAAMARQMIAENDPMSETILNEMAQYRYGQVPEAVRIYEDLRRFYDREAGRKGSRLNGGLKNQIEYSSIGWNLREAMISGNVQAAEKILSEVQRHFHGIDTRDEIQRVYHDLRIEYHQRLMEDKSSKDIRENIKRVYDALTGDRAMVNDSSKNKIEKIVKKPSDRAMKVTRGGIDLNSANLAMLIKRDGKGVVLPLRQQDLAQLSDIEGLDPVILSIKPASETPVFSQ